MLVYGFKNVNGSKNYFCEIVLHNDAINIDAQNYECLPKKKNEANSVITMVICSKPYVK